MTYNTFEYESDQYYIVDSSGDLNTDTVNGITCTWIGKPDDNKQSFEYKWIFDWDELKKQGVVELNGYILAKRPYKDEEVRIEINLTESNQIIEKSVPTAHFASAAKVSFHYYLVPHYFDAITVYEKMFSASDKTDAILIVEEKKLNVNKAFLSFHSDYFSSLFSSSCKEGKMAEISISEVSYEDFGLFLSTIYPDTVFPTDRTVPKLLELGNRFLIKSVIAHVEYHLLHNSKIGNEKMLGLADKYGMTKLCEKTLREMDTVEKAKNLKNSEEYEKLSDGAKVKVLDRLFDLI